jgi:hypothetical protein
VSTEENKAIVASIAGVIEVEPGLGQETVEQAGTVLHPPERS